ncbi:uncharacterized protein VDAG_02371 [Verticillium dahliae VdLs.17]|uniref:Uncharacterized protein n=1 Tax=Verticillium dahliae (strain VdLs.17 / ATCC MYA-4575 / FGSC 10137) TaxID=498257 RepID=G2WXN9_VERDV|nr:uncharacterized protein VDAG_02371 [Verticillium dahliae VdLs.17]EGY20847.1 hypothetical protein VDAG_02371 [Verticillium dahliae VdLs.17]
MPPNHLYDYVLLNDDAFLLCSTFMMPSPRAGNYFPPPHDLHDWIDAQVCARKDVGSFRAEINHGGQRIKTCVASSMQAVMEGRTLTRHRSVRIWKTVEECVATKSRLRVAANIMANWTMGNFLAQEGASVFQGLPSQDYLMKPSLYQTTRIFERLSANRDLLPKDALPALGVQTPDGVTLGFFVLVSYALALDSAEVAHTGSIKPAMHGA